jgi:arsenical pump membrane protein
MVSMFSHDLFIVWCIIVLATLGVITRPFRLPEATWAVAGAVTLVILGLLPWSDALNGMRKGTDVYFFLIGMMLIAELSRLEGLFDWLAALAVARARGSPQRLFLLIYLVGILVTVLLSNDATAIVLTPAVYAATRAAGATPLPYLFVCAFIANAASFVLPISNPANLVVFGERMPHLADWLRQFALPSLAAIVVTYAALRLSQRRALDEEKIESAIVKPRLSRGGKLSAFGIAAVGVILIGASALNFQLGLPTLLCVAVTSVTILGLNRQSPKALLSGVSWSVLPLVAGLFVMVEALIRTGAISRLAELIGGKAAQSEAAATWGVGIVTALADNIANNLPVGLIAGSVVANDHLPASVTGAMLIGVDLGPNLSITGSLATILWLVALRREKIEVNALRFLGVGLIVMPPALIASLLILR